MRCGDTSKITWEQFNESFYAKFFSANVKYAKQQEFLKLEQGDMIVEQYDAEFDMLSRFTPNVVTDEEARTEKFVKGLILDLQGIVRALRPTTYADALHLALDFNLYERANLSKAAGRGSTLGQKRKVESQPALAPQRNLRSGGVREFMEVIAWKGAEFALGASNQGIALTFVLRNSLRLPRTSLSLPSREEFLPLLVRRPSELDFDVILGMDWFSANYASIDYSRKEVVFNPPLVASFKFKGAGTVVIPKVISALKYPDVFHDELPGLPPLREIDFSIELESDTVSISRAPYRMAPAELKELKVLLQKCTGQGSLAKPQS
ncbi:ty3-gypsy retrotransposon protein [Cucumis melo var. makuwa]|uniref:Ty3-gypsy retrotransposon protein n=1 Tax=Cucumis melo var. makuwa TaxID=1194695 RepID=A0A5D3BPD4_CUCMM|nr:ty3-gypsy retrotransposon protein [Cucumis melo var. makuwa]TYK01015.1 ty3-gypsy retrotransposon protein [Cucumis melo var. makuwa]